MNNVYIYVYDVYIYASHHSIYSSGTGTWKCFGTMFLISYGGSNLVVG
jgi:hypothetical protein